MTSATLQEGLRLTVIGLAVTFLALALLTALVLGMRWLFQTRWMQNRTGVLAEEEAAKAKRDKAMAAAIAVTIALAEGEETPGAP